MHVKVSNTFVKIDSENLSYYRLEDTSTILTVFGDGTAVNFIRLNDVI